MPKEVKESDKKAQGLQKATRQANLPLLLACHDVTLAVERGEGLSPADTTALLQKLVDSITVSSHAFSLFNQQRRALVKPLLEEKFVPLCHPDNPVGTDSLFGDNLHERITKLREETAVSIVKASASQPTRFRPYNTTQRGRPHQGSSANWRQKKSFLLCS